MFVGQMAYWCMIDYVIRKTTSLLQNVFTYKFCQLTVAKCTSLRMGATYDVIILKFQRGAFALSLC